MKFKFVIILLLLAGGATHSQNRKIEFIEYKLDNGLHVILHQDNNILGGSTSRLFYNLRETHGFTYGAYSNLDFDELAGSFSAFTDVRNIATDSAIYEILYEINRIMDEKVPYEELQLFKNELNGNFALALENPQTIANFALNVARYDLDQDYYTTYLQRLAGITQQDIARVATKYLNPDNAYIIVVGRTPDIADNLRRFAADGRIRFFDEDGIEYAMDEKLRPAPAGITAETVTNNYIKALGGYRRMRRVRDITSTLTTTMHGMPITITSYNKTPNKFRQEIGSGGVVFSTQIFDGHMGTIFSPMGTQQMPAELIENLKFDAMLNIELHYNRLGIRQELLGIQNILGTDAYKINVILPNGATNIYYYDVKTGLRIRSSTAAGTADYSDYREVNGLKFPHIVRQTSEAQSFELRLISVKVNSRLNDNLFMVD